VGVSASFKARRQDTLGYAKGASFMSLVYLLLVVIAFAVAIAIVNWLVPDTRIRNFFYAALAFIGLVLLLQAMGAFGGQVIRIR
jgi:hypothetical protein